MTIKRLRQEETETETVVDSLPESLKLHILSFLDTRHAVETSVLSKSWVSSWSCVPVLNFSSDSFQKVHPLDKYLRVKPLHRPPPPLHAFDNFVINALSRRQPVKLDRLTFKHAGSCNTEILKQFFDYALLHGVQELEASVARTIDAHKYWIWPISSSDSLTSLTLHSPMPKTWSCVLYHAVFPFLWLFYAGCGVPTGWDRFYLKSICKGSKLHNMKLYTLCKLGRMMSRVLGSLVFLFTWTKNWLHHFIPVKSSGTSHDYAALKLRQFLNMKFIKCKFQHPGMVYGAWPNNYFGDKSMGQGTELIMLLEIMLGLSPDMLKRHSGAGFLLLLKVTNWYKERVTKGRVWAVFWLERLLNWRPNLPFSWWKLAAVVLEDRA
ncbi:putative F-box-like domain superfamily protein [Helianthus debilis subsp. tardiflorus]